MIEKQVCMRCHVLCSTLTPAPLRLCPACPKMPACGEFQHAYVGSSVAGTLICLRCGSTLTSQAIRTDPPEEPAPPSYDDYC